MIGVHVSNSKGSSHQKEVHGSNYERIHVACAGCLKVCKKLGENGTWGSMQGGPCMY